MKEIRLELVKDKYGIIITNLDTNSVDYYDDTEMARKEFVKFIVEFMNTEVEDGTKYK